MNEQMNDCGLIIMIIFRKKKEKRSGTGHQLRGVCVCVEGRGLQNGRAGEVMFYP